jgi:uncharacterized membrane protein YfcA
LPLVPELLFLAALLLLGALSGATAAVIGFGIGSLLTPLLVARLDPGLAVAAVSLPHLLATAVRFAQHRQAVDRTVLLRFGLPSALGGLAGALLQARVAGPALVGVLGGLLIATGLAALTRGFGGWRPQGRTAAGLGLLSGVFGGIAGNQGGLRAAGLTAFDLSPRAYLATSTAVALAIDLARTPVYLAKAGAAVLELWTPIAIAAAGCLLGTLLGERLFMGLSPERYRRVVGVAVMALGAWLILRLFG